MGRKDTSAQWISLSDMMTSLMLIFLLIAVAFMYQIELEQQKKNKVLVEYNESKETLYLELKNRFEQKEQDWWMEIDKDLEINFNKQDIEFDADSYELKESFKDILKDFIPAYLTIINDSKYSNRIEEIRIEWHTGFCRDDEYEECLILSQRRSNSVLLYLTSTPAFQKLSQVDKDKLQFWMTSNGMADWKLLDDNGDYIYSSKKQRNDQKSRRVEFKIITNSDSVIGNIINQN